MIRMILVSIFLVVNMIWDIKIRKLPLAFLVFFGVIAVIVNLMFPEYSLIELGLGVAVGIVLLVISYVTAGQIGDGDGILFVVVGLYIGGVNNLQLLLWAMIICAVVAGTLLVTRQVGRKDRIPFVPFVLFAYIGQVIL